MLITWRLWVILLTFITNSKQYIQCPIQMSGVDSPGCQLHSYFLTKVLINQFNVAKKGLLLRPNPLYPNNHAPCKTVFYDTKGNNSNCDRKILSKINAQKFINSHFCSCLFSLLFTCQYFMESIFKLVNAETHLNSSNIIL